MTDQKQFEKDLENSIRIINEHKGLVNAMMEPEFVRCDLEEQWAEFRFPVKDWEVNIVGQLHGGLEATMFDFSMGVLTRSITGLRFVPTIEINITYFRPVSDTDAVIVRTRVEKLGKRVIHLSAELFNEKNGKKAAMARGMFFNENTS